MIAADTSSLIAYLNGQPGKDVVRIDAAIDQRQLHIAPVVQSELLSDPLLPTALRLAILSLPLLDLGAGYWERVAGLRMKILKQGLKAKMVDAMIAQCCIDYHIPLLTRDTDFRHFVRLGGLNLGVPL